MFFTSEFGLWNLRERPDNRRMSFFIFLKGENQGLKVDEKKYGLSMNVISYSYTCRRIHFSVLNFIENFLCFRRFVKECLGPSILEIQTQMEQCLNLEH